MYKHSTVHHVESGNMSRAQKWLVDKACTAQQSKLDSQTVIPVLDVQAKRETERGNTMFVMR